MEAEIKVGDRVTRKNVNAFRYMQGINGTVVSITYDKRCFIKWDIKANTGQQHSTINPKFLSLIQSPNK